MPELLPSRRLVTKAAAATAFLPVVHRRPQRPRRRRPNVLWLISEDNNPFVGAYGDSLARTPVIDALAAAGVTYRNAYSASPVCAPSRYSMITATSPEANSPAEHMRATAELPAFLRAFPQLLREAGYYCTNNVKTDYNAAVDLAATWDDNSPTAHWRNRPAGAPFFAVFTYFTTHESMLFQAPAGATDPARVRVPAYLPDTANIRNDRACYYDLMATLDTQLGERLDELDADGLSDDTVVFYLGDNGGALPWSKRHATEDGLRVPLVVRYPPRLTDAAPARPGTVLDTPVTLTDLGPTVLSLAGLAVPGYAEGRPLTRPSRRHEPRYAFGGRGRMDERYDLVRTVTDGRLRYVRTYLPHRPYGQVYAYAWQQKGYQDWHQAHLDGTLDEVQDRFWIRRPAEELYLTHADPDHSRNLARDPRFRRHLRRLRRALDDHMIDVNDNGFIPEGSPPGGYVSSRRPGAYPLRRVKALADRAITRDVRNLRRLVRALGDDDDVIRYWAALGLLMLHCDGHHLPPEPLERHWDGERSAPVQVVLAEILLRSGADRPALQWLGDAVDTHPHPRIRLQALNALTYAGTAATPALPAVDRALTSTDEYIRNAARYLALALRGIFTPQTPLYP